MKSAVIYLNVLQYLREKYPALSKNLRVKEERVKAYIIGFLNEIDKQEIKLALLEDTDSHGSRVLDLLKPHKEIIVELEQFVNDRIYYGKSNGV